MATSSQGRALIYQPSLRTDESTNQQLIGLLTDRVFTIHRVADGKLIASESLPLKRSSAEARILASNSHLSWEFLSTRLIVLHPLNRSLYYTTDEREKKLKALRKTALTFESLSADAYLTSVDAQWVISSPGSGEVFGVHPQLDQVVWRWQTGPFKRLSLSRSRALFDRGEQAALHRVVARSLDELAQQAEASASASSCSKGDRWGCLYQGDILIGIPVELSDQERRQKIMRWYDKVRHAKF